MGFFMAELNGRYFFTNTDASPYIGGGMAWDYLNLTLPGTFSGQNTGLGVFGEAGVEVLRTYHTHLSFGVRVDLPFFSLSQDDNCPEVSTVTNGVTTFSTTCPQSTYYYWPFSLEARLTF
jgi:hypothetical protein